MKNVLFICTGNTCRSPMAEALLRHYAPDVEVKSAGLYAADGQEVNEKTLAVLEEKGIRLNHAARSINAELMEWADLVLTMTAGHRSMLLLAYPESHEKIATLKEYTAKQKAEEANPDIADPFGANLATYQTTYEELKKHIQLLVSKL